MHKLLFYILILVLLYIIYPNNKLENYENWLKKQKKLIVL